MKKKATEDQFNELHNLVTKEFLTRIKSGDATTQDLKAACDWLKTNDISGVAMESSPLAKLAAVIRWKKNVQLRPLSDQGPQL